MTIRYASLSLFVAALLLAVFFRYSVTASGNGYNYYKLDRWTGTVVQCSPVKCSNE